MNKWQPTEGAARSIKPWIDTDSKTNTHTELQIVFSSFHLSSLKQVTRTRSIVSVCCSLRSHPYSYSSPLSHTNTFAFSFSFTFTITRAITLTRPSFANCLPNYTPNWAQFGGIFLLRVVVVLWNAICSCQLGSLSIGASTTWIVVSLAVDSPRIWPERIDEIQNRWAKSEERRETEWKISCEWKRGRDNPKTLTGSILQIMPPNLQICLARTYFYLSILHSRKHKQANMCLGANLHDVLQMFCAQINIKAW